MPRASRSAHTRRFRPASRASAAPGRPASMPRAAPLLPSSTPASTSPTPIWSRAGSQLHGKPARPRTTILDGHGTFVAGVIGARNEGAGVVGVAPGTELYAVKVLDAHRRRLRAPGHLRHRLGDGEREAARHPRREHEPQPGASVEALHLAIKRSVSSGIVYTVAAGNAIAARHRVRVAGLLPRGSHGDRASDTDGAPGRPGPASCEAGESTTAMRRSPTSPPAPPDIAHVVAAPGVCIESTVRGGGLSDQHRARAPPLHMSRASWRSAWARPASRDRAPR